MTEPEKTQPPIRVMITDDHPIIRQGLRMMLESYSDLEIVAEAEDGEQAVRLALEIQPDVLVMDIQMPVKDGITAIQEITQANPDARILVLTSFPEDDYIFEAIKAGALGFHLKESSPEQLVDSIRAVFRENISLHPIIARKLIREIKHPQYLQIEEEPLSPRELDVLNCLARGLSNQEIAAELTISVRTVTTHVRNILDKLHLSNRTQAALYAVQRKTTAKPEHGSS